MKKWIIFLLAFCLLFGLAGCGKGGEEIDEIVDGDEEEEILDEEEVDPSEGEPFVGDSFSKMVGSYTIKTEWIPFDEPLVVDDIFSGYVAVSGNIYYVLTDGLIKQYKLEDGSLVHEKDLLLEEEYSGIHTDEKGTLYASAFMADFVGFRDGEQIFAHDGPDEVAMHTSGGWGVSWFSGPDVEVITLGDGAIESEDWNIAEVSTIRHINIGENHIFVSGSSVANEEQAIFVYDLNKKLQLTLGDKEFGEPDSLGSVTVVIETSNGFMALDGNMRDVLLWKADGTFIGKIDDKDLFGTSYPWMSTAVLLPDGSIIAGMTEKRADESAVEFLLYRLTGF